MNTDVARCRLGRAYEPRHRERSEATQKDATPNPLAYEFSFLGCRAALRFARNDDIGNQRNLRQKNLIE
jgi:hypothetical protein